MRKERQAKGTTTSGNRSTRLPGLRAVRCKRGLTQRELAALAGTGPSTISYLEGGRRGGYPKTIRRLADALKSEVAELIEG